MSTSRHRGRFWSPGGDTVPGTLEISESGDLRLEIQGRIHEGHSTIGGTDETVQIAGEIAHSPVPGPTVTLFRCVRTKFRFGTGGSEEHWFAQRALIGRSVVKPDAVFTKVTMSIRGLAQFLGRVPALGDWETPVIHLPSPRTEVERFTTSDWTVTFGWKTSSRGNSTYLEVKQSPFIEVELAQPCSVDAVLGEIVPIFEAILTMTLQAHARAESITVSSSDGRDTYHVFGPRVGAAAAAEGEPHQIELLFSLAELPEKHALIGRVRQLFSQYPEFTALFLGHERAPPRYVEDRMRGSVLALSHLAGLFPAASHQARQWLDSLEHVPVQVRAFLPSAALVAVPELARELLTAGLCTALRVTSKESFVEGIGLAFRWATLREGVQASGRDMLRLHHQLRALTYLVLLRYLGFAPDEAERRIVRYIEDLGIQL
ncbi:MAG TPA: hypothetical protein VF815_11625 [Myxococcaceae bacterium]|jgi:hypothetical protein